MHLVTCVATASFGGRLPYAPLSAPTALLGRTSTCVILRINASGTTEFRECCRLAKIGSPSYAWFASGSREPVPYEGSCRSVRRSVNLPDVTLGALELLQIYSGAAAGVPRQ